MKRLSIAFIISLFGIVPGFGTAQALTPIGAEASGNPEGSIPGWTGGLLNIPAGYDRNMPDVLPDPYAGEKPIYRVNSSNLKRYQHWLSDGHIALIKKRPDHYYMDVYASHRSAAYPDSIYKATAQNSAASKLTNDGNGLSHYQTGVPFPKPTMALEVIWNHITRYRGDSIKLRAAGALVQEDGDFSVVRSVGQISFNRSLIDGDDNMLFYLKSRIVAPARLAGDVLLVHETFDQVKDARKAWLYNSGQRRVRRVPDFAYDSPIPFSDGFVVADQVDMFNGAPDRYEWKLLGKKELLIPYNSYALFSKALSYKDLLKVGHVEPEYIRYELHRVWVVEANLKAGHRHIYAKRVFYIDEDTWQISVIDYYDGRQELWRMGEAYALYFYNEKIPLYAFDAIYDLKSDRYVVTGISNEEEKSFEFGIKAKKADYTPTAIRRESSR